MAEASLKEISKIMIKKAHSLMKKSFSFWFSLLKYFHLFILCMYAFQFIKNKAYLMCKIPLCDWPITAPSEQVFNIAKADCTSNWPFSGTTQTRNGGFLPPPRARFLDKASSRLFLRIWFAWWRLSSFFSVCRLRRTTSLMLILPKT